MKNYVAQTDLLIFKEELESIGADNTRGYKMSTKANIEIHKLYTEGRKMI